MASQNLPAGDFGPLTFTLEGTSFQVQRKSGELTITIGTLATLSIPFSEADGFLQTLFGVSPSDLRLPAPPEWSSISGFSLAGSTGFEVTVVPGPPASDAGSTADGTSGALDIADQAFRPNELTVVNGAKVTWTNSDAAAHTVAAGDQSWSSDLLPTGATFDHVFDTPGRFEYVCTLHPGMKGTIVVTDASVGPAAVTPAAATLTAATPAPPPPAL